MKRNVKSWRIQPKTNWLVGDPNGWVMWSLIFSTCPLTHLRQTLGWIILVMEHVWPLELTMDYCVNATTFSLRPIENGWRVETPTIYTLVIQGLQLQMGDSCSKQEMPYPCKSTKKGKMGIGCIKFRTSSNYNSDTTLYNLYPKKLKLLGNETTIISRIKITPSLKFSLIWTCRVKHITVQPYQHLADEQSGEQVADISNQGPHGT